MNQRAAPATTRPAPAGARARGRASTPALLLSLATALAAGTACGENHDPDVPAPATAAPLTPAQARNALVTPSDLGTPWAPAGRTSPADDGLLGGTTEDPECQKLLDGLRDGNVLGQNPMTQANAYFAAEESRLTYRAAPYSRSAAEDGIGLLKRLPLECDRFTAALSDGERATVQVVALNGLPDVGDENAGLTVTITATLDGLPAKFTSDVAAVRMGPNVAGLTNGGLDGADKNTTRMAVEAGAHRLSEVLSGRTPAPLPSLIE